MITYSQTKADNHLRQILQLQAENLEAALADGEIQSEGYVTVNHDYNLLAQLADPQGHTVALEDNMVVGYALVMMPRFGKKIDVLLTMFESFENCSWRGRPLTETAFHVMGQVCIAKSHRGRGLFRGLYDHQRVSMAGISDVIITEVAARNVRSLNAHLAIGFEPILEFSDDQEHWHIIGLPT